MKRKIFVFLVILNVSLLFIGSTLCIAEEASYKTKQVSKFDYSSYDFSLQEAMVDEALKHLGEHYLKDTCGGIGRTTPKVWSGVVCNTWKQYHKKEKISCIGVRHFDCSGFVYFCANAVGFNFPWLPGYPSPQYWYDEYVTPVPLNKVHKGTLVFKGYSKHHKIKMAHVGIYLGNGKVIECGGAAARVCITSWDAWLDGAHKGYYHLLAGNLLPSRISRK